MYGADGVTFLPAAEAKIRKARRLGYGDLPVCMAKTQDSLSDNPKLRGRPTGVHPHRPRHRDRRRAPGFLVALTGEIVRMPGLPERPAAERIDVDEDGRDRRARVRTRRRESFALGKITSAKSAPVAIRTGTFRRRSHEVLRHDAATVHPTPSGTRSRLTGRTSTLR